jgi:hypothetical protein
MNVDPTHQYCVIPFKLLNEPWDGLHDPLYILVGACRRDRRHGDDCDGTKPSLRRAFTPYIFWGNLSNAPNSLYNPARDPNAVYYGGTYAGSDPDPNIRAALIREFGRRSY